MAKQPLNILWLIDHVCYDGSLHGGGRLYYNLLPKFNPEKVKVFPYFLRASPEVRSVFKNAPVPVSVLDKGKYDVTTFPTLLGLCRRHQIDVMHLFCYASSTFGRAVGRFAKIPTVIHDFDTQIYFPYPIYLKILDRLLAPKTGRAIAASPLCRKYMNEVRRIPKDRIEIMHHALPEARLEAAQRHVKSDIRASLGWSHNSVVFCAATKLGPDRGNKTLLKAFARVAAGRPEACLVVVYKPTYYHRVPKEYEHIKGIRDADYMRKEIDELIADLEISPFVQLVESLDDPEQYFAASDVSIAPFRHVRFSSVNIVEGLAFGCPIIGTNIGEQREVVDHEVNGLLVPPGDVDALAEAMIRLIDNPSERDRMSKAARRSARRFSVGATAERLEEMYETLSTDHLSYQTGKKTPLESKKC